MKEKFIKGKEQLMKKLDYFATQILDDESDSSDLEDNSGLIEVNKEKKRPGLMKRIKAITMPEQAWRINSFKKLGLTDPLVPTKTINQTLDSLIALDFETPVYPCLSQSRPPRCIFIPTSLLLKRMLMAVVAYGD